MLESLTATAFIASGTATAIPTAHSSIATVQKIDEKRGAQSTIAQSKKNTAIIASLTASMSTASIAARDQVAYGATLANAYACVESMSDEQLEAALIAIGELEGEMELTDQNVKTI